MTGRKFVCLAAGIVLAASLPRMAAAAGDSKTVGRVRVTTVQGAAASAADNVSAALAARFAASAGKRFPDTRIVSVRPRPDDPSRFDVTIYDYSVEKAFDLVLGADGKELSRKPLAEQPARMMDEYEDAVTIVRENASFAPGIATGALTLYEPMPPTSVGADGRRLVNVGLMSPATAGASIEKNEIVSVNIPTGSVIRYASGAPETSRAELLSCGPSVSDCSYASGPCSSYQIAWPALDPVWKLKIRHPNCTTDVQADATGLELTDVYYRGKLILKRAEMPVLNVKYSGDTCGPYRDWLWSEDCFQATGTDAPSAGSGIRVASSSPSTLCESGSDAGNFRGVAIYDQGDALWLLTETKAGWYRYVMEWRLHLDGTIEPIIGFGATSNSCTCNLHFHHAYWRFEWGIDAVSDGTTDDPATGICTLERRHTGTQDVYDPVTTEGTFLRPSSGGSQDFWRIKNPVTGSGYIVQPGPLDGNANGDAYGQWDFAALDLNSGQINDPNSDTSIAIGPWINGETLGSAKRLVTWYHATFTHDDPNGHGEACELAGPKLVPVVPCAGSISLGRSAYTCSSSVSVLLTDSDLVGAGTASVTVTSGTETTPETLVLTETPAGSGRFLGSIATYGGAPVHGDGKISVVTGNTIDVQYVDASSCGAPNVSVHKTATVDCVAPSITNVQAVPGASNATISWNTNEAAGGIVHYGTSLPTGSSTVTTGTSLVHAVTVTGLTACTTYYFWVESTDAAGNLAASNAGGGYFAFRTVQSQQVNFTSTDTPVSIPDNNATGATSTISVANSAAVQDVNVTLNITHTYDNDLLISLITPQNTSITLAAKRGGAGNDFQGTVFDDEAATAIGSGTAPFAGSFKPDSALSTADGISGAGNWKLKAVDQAAQDTGTIVNWTLGIGFPSQTCASPSSPRPVPDGSFGSAMKTSRTADTSMHITWDAATCPAKNNHLLYGTLQNLSTFALTGAVCGLGPLGSYDWAGVPAGNVWFVVVGDDASAVEGSWGTTGTGAQRNGTNASGQCGFATRSNTATCP